MDGAEIGRDQSRAVAQPPLSVDLVHVWRVALDRDPAMIDAEAILLTPDERARAARFRFVRDRQRFVTCRAALRRILGGYTGRPPGELRFRYGPNGKPSLSAEAGESDIAFNVAHSEGLALIACWRGGELGVDLEAIRPIADLASLAVTCLTPAELRAWYALPDADRLGAFYRCWARKEALLKAQGAGIGAPLTEICVGIAPRPAPWPLESTGTPGARRHLTVDLDIAPGMAAALTVHGTSAWGAILLDYAAAEAFRNGVAH